MIREIEKSKKLLKEGRYKETLAFLEELALKSYGKDNEIICAEIARVFILKKEYIKAIEKIGILFNDKEMDLFLESIDEYINERNKERIKNILLNNFEILKRKTVLKSKPSSMLVVLTNKCNLKCVMCHVREKNYTLSADTLKDIIGNMKYFEKLTCHGGEVFLYNEFGSIMKYARIYDTELNISTNGLYLGENLSKFENMKASIGVSIDGFDKITYEKIRVNSNFEVLLENLEALKECMGKKSFQHVNTCMYMIIMKDNYHCVKDAFNFALKYKFNAIRFLKLNFSIEYMPDKHEFDYAIKQIHECMDIVDNEKYNIQIFTDPNLNVVRKNRENLYNDNGIIRNNFGIKCDIPWKNISIAMNNEIYFDCRCDCNQIGKFETIEKSWNGKEIKKIRQAIIDGNLIEPCIGCAVLD